MVVLRKRNFCIIQNQRASDGFTLIELLVVIAVIVLLASLASVVAMEARDRGRDTRIQTSLAQVRFEAAMVHNQDGSYVNLCDANSLNDGPGYENLAILKADIRKYSGSDPECYASLDAYCVQSSLVTGGAYCLDSTGYAGADATDCDGTDFSCY